MTSSNHKTEESDSRGYVAALTLAALGVVYGDIGTSPLYALRECFFGAHAVPATHEHVLGILSLVFWSLTIIISIDYLIFILSADNHGEGGELALMALLPKKNPKSLATKTVIMLGLAGAALLYGDGMITPAISVLSAVEGLAVAAPVFEPYILGLTVFVLCLLFSFQSKGTSKVGTVFGPVIVIWFLVLGILGGRAIFTYPKVLEAMNPMHAINFLLERGFNSAGIIGSVFLAVTGGEALYADMGHFGKVPIRIGWYGLVLPCLLLNYFGQGAILITGKVTAGNPFYSLCPEWALLGMVVLATLATVIASQAVIAGAFSITRQAIQLGYLPRMAIKHTSSDEIGQIYVPLINWFLLICTVWLVFTFRSSSNLASAYGFSVATTMVITTILMWFVARDIWKWPMLIPGIGWAGLLSIKLAFFGAAVIKIPSGGWFPLSIGAVMLLLMTTWWKGRRILAERLTDSMTPVENFISDIEISSVHRVSGTAIFMTKSIRGTPPALIHNLTHNKVLHQKTVLMAIRAEEVPRIKVEEGVSVEDLGNGIYKVVARCGFMDSPNVLRILRACKKHGLEMEIDQTTFFLGNETLLSTSHPGMAPWRAKIFSFMSRNSQRATAFFKIPPDRVVEIGLQVEL